MKVEYKNRSTTFAKKEIKKLSFDDFDALCRELSTFKAMPPKTRDGEIKRLYDDNIGKAKKTGKSGSSGDIRGHNNSGSTNAPRSKQKPADEGTGSDGAKGDSELSAGKVREKKKPDES